MLREYGACSLCPRKCKVNRLQGEKGYCGQTAEITAARAALHYWEEPCISGTTGSGAVFFSGCNMGCAFCQNQEIARGEVARSLTIDRLSDIYLELQAKGAANINLVTASHFIPSVAESLRLAKKKGLNIPVVYNSSAYETTDALRLLDGLVDVYLPDCKYHDSILSAELSKAPDYFETAMAAIEEMVRQVGDASFYPVGTIPGAAGSDQLEDKDLLSADEYNDLVVELDDDYEGPLVKKGVIVRHLVLPGHLDDSKKVLLGLNERFGNSIYISIMNQYTPLRSVPGHPELDGRVPEAEYEELLDFAADIGIENAFLQAGDTAKESFIPDFDYTGL